MCNSKPLALTCNSQLYNSYNNDVIFLKAKVMISEGLSTTILFMVIFRRETWNCTAAALYFTRHLCLFIYFSSVVHVILRQGQTTKTLHFRFKTTEQVLVGNFASHSIRPLCADVFWRYKFCLITEVNKDCKSPLSQFVNWDSILKIEKWVSGTVSSSFIYTCKSHPVRFTLRTIQPVDKNHGFLESV